MASPTSSTAQTPVTVEVTIGSVWVKGTAPEGAAVAVTHRRAADGDSATFQTVALPGGQWSLPLTSGEPFLYSDYRFLDPGDRVTVEVDGGGDPVVLTVPPVHVESDPDGDRITGSVPPGVTASVEVIDPRKSSDKWSVARIVAPIGQDGRFGVSTAPGLDLLPLHVGTVVLTRPDGNRFVARWSYAQFVINTSLGEVTLVAHNHLPYDVTFALPNGQPYSHVSGRIAEHDAGFDVPGRQSLNDAQTSTGRALAVRSGDRVTARLDGQAFEFFVPDLSVWADPTSGAVRGQAPPGATVEIRWLLSGLPVTPAPIAWKAVATSDGAGEFRHDLAAGEAIVGGDMLAVVLTSGRIRMTANGYASHLRIDLDSGNVSGTTRPDATAVVRWSQGGRTMGEVDTRADAEGLLPLLALRSDPGGAPFEAGDEVTLRAAGETDPSLRVVIPPLSAAVQGPVGPLVGHAEPGAGRMLLAMQPPNLTSLSLASPSFGVIGVPAAGVIPRFPIVSWQADSSFEAPYVPGGAVPSSPGEFSPDMWQPTMFALMRLAEGHVLVRRGVAPTLLLSLGGRRMCGLANPRASVSVDRTRADQSGDRWSTVADGLGRWFVETDADAVPAGGETWRGDAGGVPFSWTVPTASWSLDWATLKLRLQVQPNQPVDLNLPVDADCWGHPLAIDNGSGITSLAAADADGKLDVDINSWLGLDPRVWVMGLHAVPHDPSFHRLVLDLFPLQIEAHLGTPRLVVRASANVRVTAHAAGQDGTAIGDGAATVDGLGWATLAMADAQGAPAIVESGAQLTLAAAGEAVTLTAPPLDFDLARAQGAIGTAPPGATVSVRMLAGDKGDPYEVSVTADTAGVWRVSPSLLDARGRFDWLDVTALEARLRVNDRQTFVRTVPLDPVERRYSVWLPMALTQHW